MDNAITDGHLKQAEQDIKELQEDFDSVFELTQMMFTSIKNMEERIANLEKTHNLFVLVGVGLVIAMAFMFFMS